MDATVGVEPASGGLLKEPKERMWEIARVVNEPSEATQRGCAQNYNLRSRPKEFNAGDQVLFLDPEQANKIQPKWRGPAVIKE